MSAYYLQHYALLHEPLFALMVHGTRWDKEEAKSRKEKLNVRKDQIKKELDALTGGIRLYTVKRHRSSAYASLLKQRKIARDAGDKTRAKELTVQVSNLKAVGGLREEETGVGLSDAAIKKYLYQTLKLPIRWRKRKTGKKGGSKTETVDEVALRRTALQFPQHEGLITLILEHRRCNKLISNYLNEEKVDADGRIRCMYKATGTQSGRLSSTENPLSTKKRPKGTNLQNIDRECKDLFLPDEG